jgi:hypothetical protein
MQRIILVALSISAHIIVNSPAPRTGTIGEPARIVCQGKPAGPPTASIAAGSDLPIILSQGADHAGGGCVFSLACANELSDPSNPKFKTIFITDKTCPVTKEYKIRIPKEAKGNCVLSWGWIPTLSGSPEMYQNCIDIFVTGGSGGSIVGPDLKYYNTLNPDTQLQGLSERNRRTLFEEFFQIDGVIGIQESIQMAKDNNYGIITSSAGRQVENIQSEHKCNYTPPHQDLVEETNTVEFPNTILDSNSIHCTISRTLFSLVIFTMF